jgi:hypothetical protein
MSQSRFFQVCLFFPFVLWCLCLLLFSLLYRQGAQFILDNLYTAYRVFVPYLLFGAVVWRLARDKPYRVLAAMASFIPIAWGLFFTLFYVVMTLIAGESIERWYIPGIMAFWAIIVAYLLELLPFLVLSIFREHFRDGSQEAHLHGPSKSLPQIQQ